jgi:hypothetical protein
MSNRRSEYYAVVNRLLNLVREQGYSLVEITDEEESIFVSSDFTDDQIIKLALDTETSSLTFVHPDIAEGIHGRTLSFWLVQGNAPYELIADFTDHGIAERIAADIDSHFY